MGADVPEDLPQSENVDETRRSRKDVAVCMHGRTPKVPAEQQWDTEAQGPEHHGCVSRASDVLEMIRQKSMHRKSETGSLTAFSKAGAAEIKTNVDERLQNSDATQWRWRSYREQRSRRGEYHTVMLETPVCRAVAEYSKRKTDSMISLRVD